MLTMMLLAQSYNPDPTGELSRDKLAGVRILLMVLAGACVVGIVIWFIVKGARKLDQVSSPQHRPVPVRDPRQGFPMDPIPQNWSQDRDADVAAAITTSIPPQTDGPGRYRVEGVDKETKMDTTWYCQAASAANAKVKAELTGIIPTSITRES